MKNTTKQRSVLTHRIGSATVASITFGIMTAIMLAKSGNATLKVKRHEKWRAVILIIKCGRREFDLTPKDRILDNGAVYQIITREYFKSWNYITPVVAKQTFKKLLREGKIRKSKDKYKGCFGKLYDLYEIVEEVEGIGC